MTERGQTLSDYLLGVLLVLLTITSIFAFFPSIFAPFQEQTGNDDQVMANNLATELIDRNTTGGNTVNYTAMTGALDDESTRSGIRQSAGLQEWRNWNVTIQSREASGSLYTYGDNATGEPTATSTRYFRAVDEPACESGCQLIVRVW